MRFALLLFVAAAMLPAAQSPAAGCGAAGEPTCDVAHGAYRISLPDGVVKPPAMVFLHGWGDSAEGVMRNQDMISRLTGRGYALIAPNGIVSAQNGGRRSWEVVRRSDRARDDIEFLGEVIEDAVDRHGIDRDRVLLAGFSNGGTMVWNVACLAPGLARGYAAVSGALWEPMPERCAGPVDLFHVHGWTDRVVPLEGRPLGSRLVQGDVWKALRILREANGCSNLQPESATAEGDIWQRRWTDCAGGSIVLRLHPGGHMIPDGWEFRALDWFEALPERRCLATGQGASEAGSGC